MQKTILASVLFICTAALFFGLSAVTLGGTADVPRLPAYYADTPSGNDTPAETDILPEAAERSYTIRSYYGNVGVFVSDDPTPLYVTDIKAGRLRDVDRRMLDSGISADSYEDVLRLLEDFNS